MSEMRRDPFSGEWVLLAPKRSKRPLQKEEEGCPFCPGHEEQTPPEVYRYPQREESWQIRVVPNKYPALSLRRKADFYQGPLCLGGRISGEHYVIIEHPNHKLEFYDYSKEHVEQILMSYQTSMALLWERRSTEYVVLFKNSGASAGATISHSHSQILSLPFLPKGVIERFKRFQQFALTERGCMMCRLLDEESARGELMIDENHHFLAIAPYASLRPYTVWIAPRHHSPSLLFESYEAISSLSSILMKVLLSMGDALERPSFNYYFQVAPMANHLYHWHLELIPRITTRGGFEEASGVMINPVDPRKAAEVLKRGLNTV